jgi:hypothetical protein
MTLKVALLPFPTQAVMTLKVRTHPVAPAQAVMTLKVALLPFPTQAVMTLKVLTHPVIPAQAGIQES